MFNFIQKIIYFVLNLQENVMKKRLGRNHKTSYTNATSKKVFGLAASLELTSKTEKNKEKLEKNVKIILKKYENNPEKLLEYIERSGTKVCKISHADKLLKFIKFEEGFISTTKGVKALYLCILVSMFTDKKINLSLTTEPMFILRDLPLDKYHMIQQFHKWYAMKLNLPGFDTESQENFQKFLHSNDEDVKLLSIEEILGLKEAIARDIEAINFIVDLAKTTEGSRNAMKKITAGGATV